ncbi:M48 family metallopeptidase [Desulfovibrio ferrophilus]|uniref:YgjP-like metallopeptidase domain-containing protein n=1 Tax=Desulfovibrio ferrophilus TaxID=241368 RepID=A0A2Z6B117_9BACT|nr:SprT family zinc-dependent metalloprotease [Desulfovibrio ferrophilus]BBD09153.1 uncharacterized protein DFE_2427 [Desulfovibrio ferrophilus]
MTNTPPHAPLPAYSVRESSRAKRVTLRVSPRSGVEVVVPKGFDRDRVPSIVADRKEWLHRQIQRLSEGGWSSEPPLMPGELNLQTLDRVLRIDIAHNPRKAPALTQSGPDSLLLTGDSSDQSACRKCILTWLKQQARLHLVPWLRELSEEIHLPFERARVRAQKSRWGSCSARGTISLNCKLLFLPRPLTRHVLLHELAHIKQLNHSAEFWALLHSLDHHGATHDHELSGAWKHVPRWLG